MAYKKNYHRSKFKKKYSLDDRYDYHNKRSSNAFAKAKDSESAFKLFKDPKIAYSTGYTDGIDGSTQFSTINKHGGNEKAYSLGVTAGINALNKSRKVKF